MKLAGCSIVALLLIGVTFASHQPCPLGEVAVDGACHSCERYRPPQYPAGGCSTDSGCEPSERCAAKRRCYRPQVCGGISPTKIYEDFEQFVIFVCDQEKYLSSSFVAVVREWSWWWPLGPWSYSVDQPSSVKCFLWTETCWSNASTSTRSPVLQCTGYINDCTNTNYGGVLFGKLASTGEQVRVMTFTFVFDSRTGSCILAENLKFLFFTIVLVIALVAYLCVRCVDKETKRFNKRRQTVRVAV